MVWGLGKVLFSRISDISNVVLPFHYSPSDFIVYFTYTVRHRGMETGISESSKRVSIFPLLPREASK